MFKSNVGSTVRLVNDFLSCDSIGRVRIRLVVVLMFAATLARANFREFKNLPPDPKVDYAIRQTAEQILTDFPKLTVPVAMDSMSAG